MVSRQNVHHYGTPLPQASRGRQIANLKAKKTYVTAPPSTTEAGKITKGAPVGIVVVIGTEYIRTDANKTARDNLDNLPTY